MRCSDYNNNVRVLSQIHKKIALPHSPVYSQSFSQGIKFKTSFRNCVYRGLNNR
jgi:hypothetical protein